jgi:hypothetical protein
MPEHPSGRPLTDAEVKYFEMFPNSTGHPEWMEWPTLGHKFGGARVFRWPRYNGVFVRLRDWYFGNYLMISLGWFAFACGHGTYEWGKAREAA